MNRLIKNVIKGAYGLLLPKGARNTLRLWTMLEAPDRAPTLVDSFDASPVLVLAPHMDDEAIGCGGTLRRHVLAGANVSVVFMTDGRHGNPDLYTAALSHAEIHQSEGQLVLLRKQESQSAATVLGLGELIFLDGPDGALSDTADLVGRLASIIEEKKPAYIYLPALSDLHGDHWATNRIFRACLNRMHSKNLTIRGYEVWTPLLANRLVDVSSVIEDKRKAIAAFASQTKFVDYDRVSTGLAAYRSMMHFHGRGYVEAFFESTAGQYVKLFDVIKTS